MGTNPMNITYGEKRHLWGWTSSIEGNVIYGDRRHLWRETSSMGMDVIYGRIRDGKCSNINRLPIDARPRHLCARPATGRHDPAVCKIQIECKIGRAKATARRPR